MAIGPVAEGRNGIGPPSVGEPRPGHGTVYLTFTATNDGGWRLLWSASWQDPYDEPGPDGETARVASVQGSREEVLAWIRQQPAAAFVMPEPGTDGFIPIPELDEDVLMREARSPRRFRNAD
jgi:hypothetical protein